MGTLVHARRFKVAIWYCLVWGGGGGRGQKNVKTHFFKKVEIAEETDFLRISQKSYFPKIDYKLTIDNK